MQPNELRAFLQRHDLADHGRQGDAAAHLAAAPRSLRAWLSGQNPIPPYIVRLCAYIDAHGLLPLKRERVDA